MLYCGATITSYAGIVNPWRSSLDLQPSLEHVQRADESSCNSACQSTGHATDNLHSSSVPYQSTSVSVMITRRHKQRSRHLNEHSCMLTAYAIRHHKARKIAQLELTAGSSQYMRGRKPGEDWPEPVLVWPGAMGKLLLLLSPRCLSAGSQRILNSRYLM